jgi:hypothetical protein
MEERRIHNHYQGRVDEFAVRGQDVFSKDPGGNPAKSLCDLFRLCHRER